MDIDALSEFGARNSDVGEPFSVVDKDRKVRLVVGSGHVVIVIENIENQDCQLLPLLDRKELVAAFVIRDIESRACLLHDLIVCVGIQGRLSSKKYSNPRRFLGLDNIDNRLSLCQNITGSNLWLYTFERGVAYMESKGEQCAQCGEHLEKRGLIIQMQRSSKSRFDWLTYCGSCGTNQAFYHGTSIMIAQLR
ncbi:uncharacterized protein K441DRAFT_241278, partial [Cenococcum geophilum 1.58]|uniref:uncharacterized protein n=1 Tax=Cenococcum geophilum 1.58 TaxID=794803 RepID=UPI00358EA396